MFKVRPQDNVVIESCYGCFQIPTRLAASQLRPPPLFEWKQPFENNSLMGAG